MSPGRERGGQEGSTGRSCGPGWPQREQGLVITRQRALSRGEHMSLEVPGGTVSAAGPGRAEGLMPSGRKKASVLGHRLKVDYHNSASQQATENHQPAGAEE